MGKLGTPAVLAGTTALVLVTTAANAQETDLGTLVLGESKRQIQTDTATPETTVGSEEIQDRQAGTVAELIDSVPGVSLVNGSTPSGSGINIRGFGANSTFGSDQKVLIQVDGANVGSEELYRIGTQLYTDPELYRKVTVTRGTVGSFEFGSGVVGGMVQLETKNASDFTGGKAGSAVRQAVQYNSNGDGVVSSTTVAHQTESGLELLANFTHREQDTQEDGAGTEIGNSAFELPSWLLKAGATFGENDQHRLDFSYTDSSTSDRDVPYDTFQTTAGSFGNVDRDTENNAAALAYSFSPGSDLVNLDVILSYADQKIDQSYISGSSPCEARPSLCRGRFSTATQNADHRYETTKLTIKNTAFLDMGGASHNLRYGVEFIRKDRKDAAAAPGATDNRFALFVVDDIETGNWTITPGLRYESSRIERDLQPFAGTYEKDALMGGLSVRYAFDNGFALFGSAAYTENLPIIDDLDRRGFRFISQSEKATTYELGGSYDNNRGFVAKLNAYHTELSDVTSYSGRDEVEQSGVELEMSYASAGGFYVDMNAAVADGEETRGTTKYDWANTPADRLQVAFGQKFDNGLDLSWEVVANADRSVTQPGFGRAPASTTRDDNFVVHNLRATWKPKQGALDGTEFRVGIENIFDEEYQPALSTRNAAGRNIKVSVAKTF